MEYRRLVIVFIISSCITIGFSVDYGDRPDLVTTFTALEHFFTWFFVLEAIVKIVALTPSVYFSSGWDLFDFFIAFVSAVGLIVSTALESAGGAIPRVFLANRLLRVGRVGRTLQVSATEAQKQHTNTTCHCLLPRVTVKQHRPARPMST